MSSIRLNSITIDDTPLIIENGTIIITDTTTSISSLSGAIVLNGGMSISCTTDANGYTSGGALTIGGGLSVHSQTFLGDNLILDSALSTFSVNGITFDRLFLDSIDNKNFYISLDGLNQHFILNSDSLILNINNASINSTTGAFFINGGISISCTSDAKSVTNGGAITIAGGMSVNKDCYLGNDVYIDGFLNVNNIESNTNLNIDCENINITTGDLNVISDNISFNNILKLNTTNCSFHIPVQFDNTISINGNVHMYCTSNATSISNGGCLTLYGGLSIANDTYIGGDLKLKYGNLYINNNIITDTRGHLMFDSENGYIFNKNPVYIESGSLSLYNHTIDSYPSNLDIQSNTNESNINFFTKSGDDNNYINIYAKGIPENSINSDFIQLGYNNESQIFNLNVLSSGDGIIREFKLQNRHGYLALITDGSIKMNGDLNILSNITIYSTDNANSTYGGALTVDGGMTISKDVYINGALNLKGDIGIINTPLISLFQNSLDVRFVNNTINIQNPNDINLSLYTLGSSPSDDNFENINISNVGINGYQINSNANGYGKMRFISIQSGNNNNQLLLDTTGNIGINTSSPSYTLDIKGTTFSNNVQCENINVSGSMTCGTLIVQNFETQSVSNFAEGIQTDGIFVSNNTTNSTNVSSGSIITRGGVGIAKDIYINGMLTCNSSGNFNSLNVTNTLNVNGKISLNNTNNAMSVTNGGCLTVAGGIGIAGDLYINGQCNLYNSININNARQIMNIYDSFNILRFAFNFDGTYLSLNRYDNNNNNENLLNISNDNGSIIFNNTNLSKSSSSGSLILSGGLSINCTQGASNISNGGALTIGGGMSVSGNTFFGDIMNIYTTNESTSIATGALVIGGGTGIIGNLNVGGNAIINGNLTVMGTTTTIETINTILSDNILVLNSGPSSSHDSGYLIQRYQNNNDNGSGDVVNDDPVITTVLPIQSSISLNTIKFNNSLSSIDNYYNNWWIKVTSGFSANQVRQIISYNGSTRTATLSSAWTNQNPANNDIINLYNKSYVGIIYNELSNVFEFGSTANDPGETYVTLSDTIGISSKSLILNSIQSSTDSATGSLLTFGGVSINCTQDASSSTCGGGLTVAGGVAIEKSLYIGNHVYINNVDITPNIYDIVSTVVFTPLNNSLDVTFLTINNNVLSFDVFLGCIINMYDINENLYCNFNIRGVNKRSSWEIITNYVGDDTGIEFSIVADNITKNGLLQYSTPDYGNTLTNIVFKYKMTTN